MSTRNLPDTVIIGRPLAPSCSWWIDADGPQGFTAYVVREHLSRMRCSKFSLLESRTDRPSAVPRNDDYRYGEVEA